MPRSGEGRPRDVEPAVAGQQLVGIGARFLHYFSYNTVSEMRFPNPEKIRKSVESCTSAWPFSILEI